MDILSFASHQPFSLETPREFRHALKDAMEQAVANVKIQQKILLCLSEAITNLVLHTQPNPSEISIHFCCDEQRWWLDILDNSQSWSPSQKFDDNLLLDFQAVESGRGIALLHAQCDTLSYTAGDAKTPNQLRLHWSYPKQQTQKTVLIVEDNDSLRLLYQAYLANQFKVLTASNGYQALQQLEKTEINLVISDIKMPEMNGFSLRKKISQQQHASLIPFIFLTGEDNALVQEQASALGIDDYLIKPVNKTQLINTITRVFGRSTQVYEQLTERIDKKISASLKPQLPATENGWNLHVASRHTGSGGGDLLLHKGSTTTTQLLVTDIMGHDDSAKFFAHAYGGYMHGLMQAAEQNQSPASLLSQISACALTDQLLSQITLTCCAVQLSNNGKVSIACAGHPAPLLISEQQVQPVKSSGVLPGLLPDAQYQNSEIYLKKGQRLALYTDGLFESAQDNDSRNNLQTEIYDALFKTRTQPITEALQEVMSLFDRLTNSQPKDDALLLLIEPRAD